ncbi:MAG: PGPGW domain-containing protein [Aeromicrobium sp.]
MTSNRFARRIAIEVAGWGLVLIGIAAIFLPGPGLLSLFAGLAILSQQYEWAERRVRPVEVLALRSAAQSVQTWPRILASVAGALALAAVGVFWGIRPDAPDWWPLADKWWLVGGWGTGGTLIGSSLIALATIVYSFRRFRGVADPEAEAVRVSTPEDD